MTAEGPDRDDVIFHRAALLRGDARTKYLEEACGNDPELAEEILDMCRVADEFPALLEPFDDSPEVIGRYEIRREIGRGAMGVVYEAFDPTLQRRIALKTLVLERSADPDAARRLRGEATLLAALRSDRIATIYSLEEDGDTLFLTMELVEGRTLRQVLAQGPLSLEDVARYAIDIADGLDHAHSQDVIHRDLKPENIAIDDSDRAVVLDFGIAKLAGVTREETDTAVVDLDNEANERQARSVSAPARTGDEPVGQLGSASTALAGSPAYMSPEQFRGEEVTPRSDIFALGCILFEALAGERLLELPGADMTAKTERLRALDDPRMAKIIGSCIAVDPSGRFSSAKELRSALEPFVAPSPWRRFRLPITIAVVGLATLLVVFVLSRPEPIVESVTKSGRNEVTALDDQGNITWVRSFDHPILPNKLRSTDTGFTSFEAQGTPKLLVATHGGGLTLLDRQTGSTDWFQPCQWIHRPVNAQGNPLHSWTRFLPGTTTTDPVIVAAVKDGPWYGNEIQFLRLDGVHFGSYLHPGASYCGSAKVKTPDGEPAFLLFGSSSSARFIRDLVPFETRVHCGAVALVAPFEGSKQAFPYSRGLPEERDWPGVPEAKEPAYLLIPPVDPQLPAEVKGVAVKEDGLIEVRCEDGRFYELDSDLHPVRCYVSRGSPVDESLQAGRAKGVPPVLLIVGGEAKRVEVLTVP